MVSLVGVRLGPPPPRCVDAKGVKWSGSRRDWELASLSRKCRLDWTIVPLVYDAFEIDLYEARSVLRWDQ